MAGDQRGVVLDALVSEGMMEALLEIVEERNASSTAAGAEAAELGLSLLLLADLAAGSERAKVSERQRTRMKRNSIGTRQVKTRCSRLSSVPLPAVRVRLLRLFVCLAQQQ